MILRFAREADAAALVEIYRPYVEQTAISFEVVTPTIQEFARRIRETSAIYPYLVAEENGIPLGYAYAHQYGERAGFHWTVETSIYVGENARGKGVGKRLYQCLLELLCRQGAKTAVALVTHPNEPSDAFHRAMGFQLGGIVPGMGHKLGTWRGLSYFYYTLGDLDPDPTPVTPIHSLDREVVELLLGEENPGTGKKTLAISAGTC